MPARRSLSPRFGSSVRARGPGRRAMRWRKLKSFLLGVLVGGAALFAFVSRAGGARRTTPPRDADPAGEGPPKIARTAERPLVALVAIGVFFVSLAVLFAWRAVRAEMQTDAVAKALTHGDEARAPALMIRYGCAGCHTIPGVPGADGQVGPELSGLVHRVYIG